MTETPVWLSVARKDAPLIVSMPHTGTEIPADIESVFVSEWLARKDTDWWIENLYDFAHMLGVTVIRTAISRSVIDVNRDPSGRSLYPGQNATELCPTTTFDGEPLYRETAAPDDHQIVRRRTQFFDPYHAAVSDEIGRLRRKHQNVVFFEAHSIRSRIPRLFEGNLPHLNVGTNSGASCALELTGAIERACTPVSEEEKSFARVTNGRFKGGYATRYYGSPERGIHAVQLELAMRGYMHEPDRPSPENWPAPYEPARAAPLRTVLHRILATCLQFARAS
jgi:formiminoglutamase